MTNTPGTPETLAFGAGVPHPELPAETPLVFGDINGDGIADLPGFYNTGNTFVPSPLNWSSTSVIVSASPNALLAAASNLAPYYYLSFNEGYAWATSDTSPGVAQYDLDGDGYPDIFLRPYTGGNGSWQHCTTTNYGPDNTLVSITRSTGAVTTVLWSLYPRSTDVAREPNWAVSRISTGGPLMPSASSAYGDIKNYYYESMQLPVPSWDEPLRRAPLGFTYTFVQDALTLQAQETTWGYNYLTASMAIGSQSGVAPSFWVAPRDSTATWYRTTTSTIVGQPLASLGTSSTCSDAPSSYPAIVLSQQSISQDDDIDMAITTTVVNRPGISGGWVT